MGKQQDRKSRAASLVSQTPLFECFFMQELSSGVFAAHMRGERGSKNVLCVSHALFYFHASVHALTLCLQASDALMLPAG